MIGQDQVLGGDALGQRAVDGDAIVLGRACGSVWVASTCSTSLVPMPKASAPNAPWVEVCESPQTIVMPGWVRPELRADDVHDALLGVAHRVQPHAELGAVLAQRLDLGARDRVGDRAVSSRAERSWDVVVLGGDGQVGAAHLRLASAQAVERLRAGDLVEQVKVDVEQVGLAFGAAHDVGVPDLLGERTAHRLRSLPSACVSHSRRQYQYMDNSSGVGVLDKTVSVLSRPGDRPGFAGATGQGDRPGPAHRAPDRGGPGAPPDVARDAQGRFVLGPRIGELAAAAGEDRLLAIAQPILTQLRDVTGESAQLYRPHGDTRICVAAAERASGLRDTVPVGAALPMTAGSAAQVLLAWEEGGRLHRGLRAPSSPRPRWPRCAGAAGPQPRPSASPAWRRCPRRCAGPAAGCWPPSRYPGRSSA